ncbi:MAG: chemotaxis protein CheW [Spirochaetales bacterium]|nr:chemotaxis protein CheW [Spirochaetales bacterium]
MDDIDALKDEFLIEAREHVNSAEKDILEIEQEETLNSELINRLFRAIHSIKGGSSFLELTAVTTLSHGIENVIDSIRNGKLKTDSNIIEVLLISVDKLKNLLDNPEADLSIQSEVNSLKQLVLSPIIPGTKHKTEDDPDVSAKPEDNKKQENKVDEVLHHNFHNKSLLSRALKKQNSPSDTGTEEPVTIKEKDIRRLMRSGYHIYKISIDLIPECDKKGRSLKNLFHNIKILGTIHTSRIDRASAGNLDSESKNTLLYHFIFSTVIEDWDILSKGLDITPVSITRLLSSDSRDQETKEHSLFEKQPLKKEGENNMPERGEKKIPADQKKMPHLPRFKDTSVPDTSLLKTSPIKPSTELSPVTKEKEVALRKESVDTSRKSPENSSIRINLSLVDKLMNLVSELVLVRNQNTQAVESGTISQIRAVAKKLNVVTSELQASIMQTRMQEVNLVFSRFTRLVRDLGKKLNKEVEIEIQGRHVELDKNIIEAIGDPLTHIIRNAVDHGIEDASERARLNKPIIGKIKLAAFHEAGHVNIKISDDGGGLDPQRLKASAIQKGLITENQAKTMTTHAVYNLIFRPGFSTASQITDVSGRGVGMDVVKSNLEKFGAVINIFSRPGEGTTFEIKLPLTLAIISGLIVRVCRLNFVIPQFNVAEIVWLYGDDGFKKIKTVNKQEVLSIRGSLIPAVRLCRILGIDPENNESCIREKESNSHFRISFKNSFFVIVLKLGNIRYGLIVDEIVDTKEIVVKPLHEQIKKCMVYSGTTVLGDGNIAIILDITNIARLANVNIRQIEDQEHKPKVSSEEEQSVLIFSIGGRELFSIPLFLIRHIEKLRITDLMSAHNREYHHYQDHIVPLIRLERVLEQINGNYLSDIYIIILKTQKPIGILAAQIIDTTMMKSSFDVGTVSKDGILGSVVQNNDLILILDTFKIIEKVEPHWFKESFKKENSIHKILVLEDTQFYSSIIKSYLKGSGIEVILARNGREGIDIVSSEKFDLIISDLEMPNVNGFEFARYIKSNLQLRNIPLVALSGAFEEKEGRQKAIQAGFDYFVTKKNKDEMFDSLQNILHL